MDLVLLGMLGVLYFFGCAIWAAMAARRAGNDGLGWFFAGLFFGPLAVVGAYLDGIVGLLGSRSSAAEKDEPRSGPPPRYIAGIRVE